MSPQRCASPSSSSALIFQGNTGQSVSSKRHSGKGRSGHRQSEEEANCRCMRESLYDRSSPVQDEQPSSPLRKAAEEPDTAVDSQVAVPALSPKKRGRPRKHAPPTSTESAAVVTASEPSSSPERRRKPITPVSSPHSQAQAMNSQRRRDSQSHQNTQSVRHGKCGCGFKGDIEVHLDQLGPLDIKTKGLKSLLAGLAFVHRDVALKTIQDSRFY